MNFTPIEILVSQNPVQLVIMNLQCWVYRNNQKKKCQSRSQIVHKYPAEICLRKASAIQQRWPRTFMVRMNDRKRGADHTPVISLFYTTLSNRSFPNSSSQACRRPGERSRGNYQLLITALVLCTYCAWSCETGGTPITWCMLRGRCLQFKRLVMLVLLPT